MKMNSDRTKILLPVFLLLSFCRTISSICDLDVMVVMDASSSVRQTFERTRTLVQRLEELLSIGEEGHRVSFIEYSGPTRKWVEIPFGVLQSNVEFRTAIDKLFFLQGTTLTGKALKDGRRLLSDRRLGVQTIVFLLTDGFSQDSFEPVARDIRGQENVELYVVAVSERINLPLLESAAGDVARVFKGPNTEADLVDVLGPVLECDKVTRRISTIRPTRRPTTAPSTSFRPPTNPITPRPLRPNPGVEFPSRPIIQVPPSVIQPNVNPECERLDYVPVCANGQPSQFTLRWHYDAVKDECCSYAWGYCRDEVELRQHPALRTKEQCETVCIR